MSLWVIHGRRMLYSEERIAREFWDFRTDIAVDFVLTLRQWGNRISTFQDAGIRIPHWRSVIPQKNGTPRTDLPSVGDSVSSLLSLPSHEGLRLRILPIKQTTFHVTDVYCPAVHFVQGETCPVNEPSSQVADRWDSILGRRRYSPLRHHLPIGPRARPASHTTRAGSFFTHEAHVHLATWVRTHEDISVPLHVWKPE